MALVHASIELKKKTQSIRLAKCYKYKVRPYCVGVDILKRS